MAPYIDCGYMGPDVLGHVYATYANSDPSWAAQYWTPWNVALLMSALVITDGEREVYDRVKAACLHPDNILGQATILASLAIPDDEDGQSHLHRDYFFNRVIPAALPYYEPILFQEPCIGSGVQMLAAASQYPEWAVKLNLIHFHGQDIDPIAVRMARTSAMLYGLNGYALRLAEAVNVAVEAREDHPAGPVSPVKSTGAALAQAVLVYRQQPDRPESPPDELSFEMLFKQTVQPTALEDVPA